MRGFECWKTIILSGKRNIRSCSGITRSLLRMRWRTRTTTRYKRAAAVATAHLLCSDLRPLDCQIWHGVDHTYYSGSQYAFVTIHILCISTTCVVRNPRKLTFDCNLRYQSDPLYEKSRLRLLGSWLVGKEVVCRGYDELCKEKERSRRLLPFPRWQRSTSISPQIISAFPHLRLSSLLHYLL